MCVLTDEHIPAAGKICEGLMNCDSWCLEIETKCLVRVWHVAGTWQAYNFALLLLFDIYAPKTNICSLQKGAIFNGKGLFSNHFFRPFVGSGGVFDQAKALSPHVTPVDGFNPPKNLRFFWKVNWR